MAEMNIKPYFATKPWAGNNLSAFFKQDGPGQIGEAFLISTLKDNEAQVNSTLLSEFLKESLPYLVKVIDAGQSLSLQVHPNDYWAELLEGSRGKTECWLILDVEPGAGIYYGFKEGESFESLLKAIQNSEDASKCLNFIEVRKGDFVEVPAGTIHAIGGGVQIIEFQQSSGITYRIWDWNREGRELHLDKAEKVLTKQSIVPSIKPFKDFAVNEVFFHHDDFILKKKGTNIIKCYSTKVPVGFLINTDKFTCEIA